LGGAPHVFKPWLDLAGAVLWYRGDVVALNAGNVSQWTDAAGNGRHATQGTAAQQVPYEVAGFGGQPCLHGDGSRFLQLPDLTGLGLTAGHLFVAVQADTDPAGNSGNDGQIWQMGPGASSYYPFSDGTIYEQALTTVRKTTANPVPALTDKHIYEIISTASEFTTLLDGAQLFTTATNAFAVRADSRICGISSASVWKGRMAEFGIFNRKLSSTEAQRVRAYIGARYGIVTS
jgi:hypothetical protein